MAAFFDWAYKLVFGTQSDREAQCIIDLFKACDNGMVDCNLVGLAWKRTPTHSYYYEYILDEVDNGWLREHVPASILFRSNDREAFGASALQATCELPGDLQAIFNDKLGWNRATVTNERVDGKTAVNGIGIVTLRIHKEERIEAEAEVELTSDSSDSSDSDST